jgi:hypothetical protein
VHEELKGKKQDIDILDEASARPEPRGSENAKMLQFCGHAQVDQSEIQKLFDQASN